MTPKCTRRPRQIVACTKGKCSRLSRRPRRCYHGLKLRGAPMETKAPSPQTIRFGDFELDARAGELRKKDRKSTRLNSSHPSISYAVFCLKKKKKEKQKFKTEVAALSRFTLDSGVMM